MKKITVLLVIFCFVACNKKQSKENIQKDIIVTCTEIIEIENEENFLTFLKIQYNNETNDEITIINEVSDRNIQHIKMNGFYIIDDINKTKQYLTCNTCEGYPNIVLHPNTKGYFYLSSRGYYPEIKEYSFNTIKFDGDILINNKINSLSLLVIVNDLKHKKAKNKNILYKNDLDTLSNNLDAPVDEDL